MLSEGTEKPHQVQVAVQVTILLTLICVLIICMKKLLDFDWLRAVQVKCNTSAKSVIPVQITK